MLFIQLRCDWRGCSFWSCRIGQGGVKCSFGNVSSTPFNNTTTMCHSNHRTKSRSRSLKTTWLLFYLAAFLKCVTLHSKILIEVLFFSSSSVDKLHPWMAGPLGGPQKQHTELLQVSGWDRVRLPGFPLPQQSRYHCEYYWVPSLQSSALPFSAKRASSIFHTLLTESFKVYFKKVLRSWVQLFFCAILALSKCLFGKKEWTLPFVSERGTNTHPLLFKIWEDALWMLI